MLLSLTSLLIEKVMTKQHKLFKGQVTSSVVSLLEDNNILVCYIPPNTTDKLQSMDLTVNKPAKDFLYSDQILKQLDSSTTTN